MGKVNQPTDVNSEIRELKRLIADLTKRVGLSSAVISRGGLRIINEGELVMVDENGVVIFKIGQVEFGEGASYGMQLNYENGVRGIVFGGTSGSQVFALCDETGRYLVTNDAASGHGLARPYLNYRLVPSFEAQSVGEGSVSMWPSTTSTSPTKLMQGANPIWHPRVSIGVTVSTTGGGSVPWHLELAGTTIASGTGSGSHTVTLPGWGTDYTPGATYGFDLYAACAGGATRAWIQCDRLYGLQS